MCKHVKCFQVSQRIVVLQHPTEASNAKNSLRLIKLCLPQTEIWQGESAEGFAQLKETLNLETTALLFPSEESQAIETTDKSDIETLILIDATWRKALKLWHLNPWLKQLKQLHFNHPPTGQYEIRKAKKDNQLSTLEALDYSLKQLGNKDNTALMDIFTAFNQQFLGFRQ